MSVLSKLSIAASKIDHRIKGFMFDLLDVSTVAAAGSSQSTGTLLTSNKCLVTAADGTKAVTLPPAVAGMTVHVINTVTTADLPVYPASSDNINALADDTAFTVPGGQEATFYSDVGAHWYVRAGYAALTSELDVLNGASSTNATTGKAAILGTNGALALGGGLDLTAATFASHPINLEGVTLAASTNVIRGASVNPTRTSGWTSFSGTISTSPAQTYSDYRELHTTGTAEVLGFGSFPYMDATASCASMFAGQDIAFVSSGATVLTAGGAAGTGVYSRWMKTTIDSATFNSGGRAAVNFKSFQANVTDVSGEETSIDDIEIASGQIGSIWRVRKTAGAIARSLIYFDSATVAPIIQDPTLFHDPNAVTCDKGLHVRIGNVSYMIPLYASDTGAVVDNW